MESQNTNPAPNRERPSPWNFREPRGSRSGRVFAGVIILSIGVLFLVQRMGIYLPDWVVSWPLLLIVAGFYVGFRHAFRGPIWVILIVIGSILLVDQLDASMDLHRYIWPIILITVGLVIIFRPRKKYMEPFGTRDTDPSPGAPSGDDTIDSVVIFGGVKKKIISKTFRGGELTTVFGGTELDLTQADVTGRIELELTQIFGGTKLVVPPHWRIQSDDLVSIFGGLDDKRPQHTDVNVETNKVLILRGTCIFGGIDIKSY
jgi:hypothetical protein